MSITCAPQTITTLLAKWFRFTNLTLKIWIIYTNRFGFLAQLSISFNKVESLDLPWTIGSDCLTLTHKAESLDSQWTMDSDSLLTAWPSCTKSSPLIHCEQREVTVPWLPDPHVQSWIPWFTTKNRQWQSLDCLTLMHKVESFDCLNLTNKVKSLDLLETTGGDNPLTTQPSRTKSSPLTRVKLWAVTIPWFPYPRVQSWVS